jgi:hypothetical protein
VDDGTTHGSDQAECPEHKQDHDQGPQHSYYL